MEVYYGEMASRRQKILQQKSIEERQQEISSGMIKPNFALVAGTELLNEQLKLIKPQVHIFGSYYDMTILEFFF